MKRNKLRRKIKKQIRKLKSLLKDDNYLRCYNKTKEKRLERDLSTTREYILIFDKLIHDREIQLQGLEESIK